MMTEFKIIRHQQWHKLVGYLLDSYNWSIWILYTRPLLAQAKQCWTRHSSQFEHSWQLAFVKHVPQLTLCVLNIQKALEQGQWLCNMEINATMCSTLTRQSLTSVWHILFLFKQQVGDNSFPLSCKTELGSCSWQVNVLWNSHGMEIMELVS